MSRKLGDMLKDLRNPGTSRQRLNEIYREANEFFDKSNKVQAWTRFTDGNPSFDTVRARFGDFDFSPVDGFHITKQSAQSIPNNVVTTVSLDSHTGGNNTFAYDSGAIRVNGNHTLIGVVGTVQWDSNGTGRRGVGLAAYNASDVQVSGVTLQSLLPTGLAADTHPFAGGIWLAEFLNVTRLRLNVIQTSGGALNMSYFRAYFFTMR